MPRVTIEIILDPSEGEDPRVLRARVVDHAGDPIDGAAVRFTLTGDGTLAAGQEAKREDVVTRDDGYAETTWWPYPRYQPRRELRSAVAAEVSAKDARIVFEDLDARGGFRIRTF